MKHGKSMKPHHGGMQNAAFVRLSPTRRINGGCRARVPEKGLPVRNRRQPQIAILLQTLQMGGAERTMLTLADGLIRADCRVDFLLVVRRVNFSAKFRARCA